jgi:hypothetical protein
MRGSEVSAGKSGCCIGSSTVEGTSGVFCDSATTYVIHTLSLSRFQNPHTDQPATFPLSSTAFRNTPFSTGLCSQYSITERGSSSSGSASFSHSLKSVCLSDANERSQIVCNLSASLMEAVSMVVVAMVTER